jgi:hypothetical protein
MLAFIVLLPLALASIGLMGTLCVFAVLDARTWLRRRIRRG